MKNNLSKLLLLLSLTLGFGLSGALGETKYACSEIGKTTSTTKRPIVTAIKKVTTNFMPISIFSHSEKINHARKTVAAIDAFIRINFLLVISFFIQNSKIF